MKNILSAVLFLMLLLPAQQLFAQSSDGTLSSSAEIVAGLDLTETQALDFGTLAQGVTATISSTDVANNSPFLDGFTVGLLDVTSGSTGNPDVNFTGDTSVTISDGTNNMTITFNFATSDDLAVSTGTAYTLGTGVALNNDGDLRLIVGGELPVGAAQVAGTYTGTTTFTVDFDI